MIWNNTFTNRLVELASDPQTQYTEEGLATRLNEEFGVGITRNAVHHKLCRTLNLYVW